MSTLIKEYIIISIIALLYIISRVLYLNEIPYGLHQDEAFTAYEAFSFITTGADSFGHRNPVYFMGWGSGTSPLYAAVLSLFFLILPYNTFVIRLPHALLGAIALYILFKLLSYIKDKRTAYLGIFIAAIIPINITIFRWGLDANIAPYFLLLGFYFFCQAIKNSRYIIFSLLFYAIALHAYATAWLYLALTLPINMMYYLYYKHDKQTLINISIASFCFIIIATPILLLIMVNEDIMAPYYSSWLTIPRMTVWRSQEFGLTDFNLKLTILYNWLIKGNDYIITDSVKNSHLLHYTSLFFIIDGLYILCKDSLRDIKNRHYSFNLIILYNFIIGIIISGMIYSNPTRSNFLIYPLIMIIAIGINHFAKYKKLFYVIIISYLIQYGIYIKNYHQSYPQTSKNMFNQNFEEAVITAEKIHKQTTKPIKLIGMPSFIWSKILWAAKLAPHTFYQTVQYENYPNAFMNAISFAHYKIDYGNTPIENLNINKNYIYIAPKEYAPLFSNHTTRRFGDFLLAI